MPSLILSSRYTTDSQLLRQAAQDLGWETLRLDGDKIPEWFEPSDESIGLFYTPPHAFEVAAQLGRALVGCPPDWTVRLPAEFLRRELRQTTLDEVCRPHSGVHPRPSPLPRSVGPLISDVFRAG